MCLELYQRWQCCSCWGFLGPQTCPELFTKCLGPRGEQDKKVVKWNEGMCTECWDRFVEEAREMAEAGAASGESMSPATSGSSRSQHGPLTPPYTPQSNTSRSHYTRGR
ncbi:hypothetical protein F5Y03DRAFT_345572 [Xylaria venustula]|nr:hypothetical protein F5Y03DRAFT_345572 [Xylaria venustula]